MTSLTHYEPLIKWKSWLINCYPNKTINNFDGQIIPTHWTTSSPVTSLYIEIKYPIEIYFSMTKYVRRHETIPISRWLLLVLAVIEYFLTKDANKQQLKTYSIQLLLFIVNSLTEKKFSIFLLSEHFFNIMLTTFRPKYGVLWHS